MIHNQIKSLRLLHVSCNIKFRNLRCSKKVENQQDLTRMNDTKPAFSVVSTV